MNIFQKCTSLPRPKLIEKKLCLNKYIKNPLEGITSGNIGRMKGNNFLVMDYFLYEFDDNWEVERFYIF